MMMMKLEIRMAKIGFETNFKRRIDKIYAQNIHIYINLGNKKGHS